MKQPVLKRPQINAELNQVFEYPLTVVVAAMGYGKTTAVRDFLDEIQANYVWLFVGSEETSAQYIWGSLTGQLAKIRPQLGNRLRKLGFPKDAPQRDRIIGIIEDYTYLTNTVLVIDDYHFARAAELDRLLELIVRTGIKGFHIIILSRTTPELNLEELCIKGYCFLLPSDLFEMSPSEVKEYFKLFGHNISTHTAEQVYEISGGWITAAYLLVQCYSATGRLELGSDLESLFETAVMSHYTDAEARILTSLSVLDSFTLPQAAYVTGEAAAAFVQRLGSTNSFIRYDERSEVYRMHNIFSAFLKKQLAAQNDSAALAELYKRAGRWHIENGDLLSGVIFFLKAKEYDLILAEFDKRGFTRVIDKAPGLIVEIFSQIPDAVKYRHPIGYLTYAYSYLSCVDMEDGARLLVQIEEHYQNDDSVPAGLKRRIAGELELIRSFLYFNDLEKMHELQLKAYKLLDGKSSIANKDGVFTFGSPHTLYLYYREKGKMLWIVKYADRVFHYYCELSHGCGTGFEAMARAEYSLETADLDRAGLYAQKALYKAQTMDQISIIICANLTLARVYAAQGEFAAARDHLDHIISEVTQYYHPIYNSTLDLCTGYLGFISCQSQYFAPWLKSGDMKQSDVLYQGLGFNYIVHAQAVLLEKNYIKLEVLCEEMLQLFSSFNNLLGYLHTHILDAAAKYNLYGIKEAKGALLPALEIGRADQIIIPFAEYGIHILPVLKALQRENETDPYLKKLAAEAERYSHNLERSLGEASARSRLTEREKEILELLVQGKSNREIADALFLAEVTVRKNITSLYRKLAVSGRTSAVKKALELKII